GDVTVIGISGITNVSVLPLADSFAHTGVQLAGCRVGKAPLKLRMLAYAYRAPSGTNSVLQVIAVIKGAVFEARARQGTTGFAGGIEARAHHKDVVVPGLLVDVSRFALS